MNKEKTIERATLLVGFMTLANMAFAWNIYKYKDSVEKTRDQFERTMEVVRTIDSYQEREDLMQEYYDLGGTDKIKIYKDSEFLHVASPGSNFYSMYTPDLFKYRMIVPLYEKRYKELIEGNEQ